MATVHLLFSDRELIFVVHLSVYTTLYTVLNEADKCCLSYTSFARCRPSCKSRVEKVRWIFSNVYQNLCDSYNLVLFEKKMVSALKYVITTRLYCVGLDLYWHCRYGAIVKKLKYQKISKLKITDNFDEAQWTNVHYWHTISCKKIRFQVQPLCRNCKKNNEFSNSWPLKIMILDIDNSVEYWLVNFLFPNIH